MKPDIIAPGYFIYSAFGSNTSSPALTCETVRMAGTSMATPVAASFALSVRRYFLDGFYPSGNKVEVDGFVPSGALLKAMMIHSAVPMKFLHDPKKSSFKSLKYPSIVQGYGRLNLSSTLKFNRGVFSNGEKIPPQDLFVIGAATSSPYLAPSANPRRTLYQAFTTKNSRHTYYVRTNRSSSSLAVKSPLPLRFTLCFTDYPASEKASKVAINKLALLVTVNRTSFYGPYEGHGAFTTGADDNTQRIDIPDVTGDTVYAISVTATQLQVTGQSYALVVTGAFTVLDDGVPTVTYGVPPPTLAPSRYGLDIDDDDYFLIRPTPAPTTAAETTSKKPSPTGTIVGVVIGAVIAIAIIAFIAVNCFGVGQERSAKVASHGHEEPSAPPKNDIPVAVPIGSVPDNQVVANAYAVIDSNPHSEL